MKVRTKSLTVWLIVAIVLASSAVVLGQRGFASKTTLASKRHFPQQFLSIAEFKNMPIIIRHRKYFLMLSAPESPFRRSQFNPLGIATKWLRACRAMRLKVAAPQNSESWFQFGLGFAMEAH